LRENADEGKDSSELPYEPVLLKSAWIPENATNAPCLFPQHCCNSCPCKERAPGISFLMAAPSGCPQPMEFEKGWFNTFFTFVDKVDIFFRRRKVEKYADYWQSFATYQMPSSEGVQNYVREHDIDIPLGQFYFVIQILQRPCNFIPQLNLSQLQPLDLVMSRTVLEQVFLTWS
jgi:hypothetical protein